MSEKLESTSSHERPQHADIIREAVIHTDQDDTLRDIRDFLFNQKEPSDRVKNYLDMGWKDSDLIELVRISELTEGHSTEDLVDEDLDEEREDGGENV